MNELIKNFLNITWINKSEIAMLLYDGKTAKKHLGIGKRSEASNKNRLYLRIRCNSFEEWELQELDKIRLQFIEQLTGKSN